MTGEQAREQALDDAAQVLADGRAEQDSRTPREAALAAWVPGGPSVDDIESRIRQRRGLPPARAAS